MAPDPEPDSNTQSPSVTSIIISIVHASCEQRVAERKKENTQYIEEQQMIAASLYYTK